MDKKIVSIIGFGNIGRFIATQLLPYDRCPLQINLIDKDEQVIGAIKDLEHALPLYPQHRISFNDERIFSGSDIIFHCAGASVPKGQSRFVTCKESAKITEVIYDQYHPKSSAFIIVVANPVEIITQLTQKLTGLPANQVLGTGTFLDSIRLDHLIGKKYPQLNSIDAVVLGEHGSSAFLSTSLSKADGKPILNAIPETELPKLVEEMKSAAQEIKATQDATIYGVGFCAMELFYALMGDIDLYAAVSTAIPEALVVSLEVDDIYLSLYSKIDQSGVKPVNTELITYDEIEMLKKSRDLIKSCFP